YTHGYGAAASPVSQVSTQGLPAFVVDEIPPTGTGPYEIVRPEIYFGELEGTWVAVNTNQPEFSGDIADEPGEDLTYEYEGAGRGSISLDSYIKRLLTSVHLRDRNLLLSDEITDESRILMRRQITDRIKAVAPFLRLDPDPYLVIAEGRLF